MSVFPSPLPPSLSLKFGPVVRTKWIKKCNLSMRDKPTKKKIMGPSMYLEWHFRNVLMYHRTIFKYQVKVFRVLFLYHNRSKLPFLKKRKKCNRQRCGQGEQVSYRDPPQTRLSDCSSCFLFDYNESRNREVKKRPMYECRCDERLTTNSEKSTCLTYTRNDSTISKSFPVSEKGYTFLL